jgi:prepilin-type N-terminal cleavage/methylation domain-containing protein
LRKGFTLLEVVVAVAILGIGVGTAMQVFSGGLKNIHRVELAHIAMNHAENVMNEILSDAEIIEPTQLSGDLDDEFSYSAEVDYWEPPQEGLTLEIIENRIELLSVVVDIHFKNDRFGKKYRAVCLKAVSTQPEMMGIQGPTVNPIEQLFGRQ